MKISASILSADFANLGKAVCDLTKSGADYIHVDVMDGRFVPCISMGSGFVDSLKKCTHLPFDVHLMVKNPELQIDFFSLADFITFHIESVVHVNRLISKIKSQGKKVGVALVPSSSVESIEYIIDLLDLILVMTVDPGFGGQSFLNSQLKKISVINSMIKHLPNRPLISVDGGVNLKNAKYIKDAGADILVIGSALFNSGECGDNINKFRKALC